MQNKLWTKDFTTITLGSVVSMMGNSIAGFAMSLFVLDYMDSTLLYAIYIFLYTLPQIAAPITIGTNATVVAKIPTLKFADMNCRIITMAVSTAPITKVCVDIFCVFIKIPPCCRSGIPIQRI